MVTVEVIPVNKNKQIIEKDVQSLFKPFNIMFALFFCSKYRIRNDVIHTNNLFYKVVSGICCLAIFIGYCISVFIKIFTIHLEGINYSKFCYNIIVCALFFSGYTLIYYTHVIESNRNVLLVYKIQNIYKIMKTRGVFVKNFIRYNWIGVAVVALYQLLWILFFTIAFSSNYEYYEVIANYVYVIFDLTGLYCVRIMRIIREPLRLWLDDVRNVQHVDDEEKACFWNKMLRIYLETLDAYQVAARTIQPGVLLFTVGTFGFAINSIAEHIEIGKRTAMSVDTFVPLAAISLTWLIRNMVLFIYLVFECEKFYSDMTEIRNTCLRLTVCRQSSDIQKIICKNIKRIHTTVFEKLNAYQLYDVDAKILLSFCGLVTGYTVVTLQFEFL